MAGMHTETKSPALLEVRGIEKSFGHVQALRGADLDVSASEIVALVGDNGAGKTTLVSVIVGALEPDAGTLRFEGQPMPLGSIHEAAARGIEMVYQDLSLAPDLDAASNLFLGREILRPGVLGALGFLDRAAMSDATHTSMAALGVNVPARQVAVRALSGGQRQTVAVARATHWASRLLIMDEPTAALGAKQKAMAFDAILAARQHGLGVLLISHDIPSVLEIADRLAVMRFGRVIATLDAGQATVSEVVNLMVG